MPRTLMLALSSLLLTLPAANTVQADETAGHEHEHHHHHHAHSPTCAPCDPAKVGKVVQVRLLDSMRIEPAQIEVGSGQTVKFVVTNAGQTRHELGIGTHDEQAAHAEMMLADPDMKHEDGSIVALEPGQTKELIWRFGKPGRYEAACQVPGHYHAGMMSTIVVKGKAG
jgi:uncharacterized cupredoxin-like copper-binding protein